MATSDTKVCTSCGADLPLDAFPRHARSKDGRAWSCKPCHRAKAQSWREQNPDKARETRERYRAKNPTAHRAASLSRNYGITEAQFEEMNDEQDGLCAICGNAEPGAPKAYLCVDHVADTTNIRGLLCSTCNAAIGLLRHDPSILAAAIAYLERPVRMVGVKVPHGVHRGRFERDMKEN